METPSPAMRRALRQAQIYGYLIARGDGLYHPGGSDPVCSAHTAQDMVRSGWLIVREGRYEITSEGRKATEPDELGD
jgi:hypothetical protein